MSRFKQGISPVRLHFIFSCGFSSLNVGPHSIDSPGVLVTIIAIAIVVVIVIVIVIADCRNDAGGDGEQNRQSLWPKEIFRERHTRLRARVLRLEPSLAPSCVPPPGIQIGPKTGVN